MKRNVAVLLMASAILAGCANLCNCPSPANAPAPVGPFVDRAAPLYTMPSPRAGAKGLVRLQVFVNEKGEATRVYVLRSSGFPDLDAAAQDEVRKWRFVPAEDKGKPVEQSVLVPIRFLPK